MLMRHELRHTIAYVSKGLDNETVKRTMALKS